MATQQLLDEIADGQGEPLTRLARRVPTYRSDNTPTSLSCLVRWVLTGVKLPNGARIRLEAARLSGRWISTPAALARFIQAQTPALGSGESKNTTTTRTLSARQRAIERADRELAAAGI